MLLYKVCVVNEIFVDEIIELMKLLNKTNSFKSIYLKKNKKLAQKLLRIIELKEKLRNAIKYFNKIFKR